MKQALSTVGEIVLIICAAVALILGGLWFWFPYFFRPHHTGGQLTACKSNLKNIGTAIEMYSTDYGGLYPPALSLLTPNYLKTIPMCPRAGKDTYSGSYTHPRLPDPEPPTFFCPVHSYTSKPPCANYTQRLEKEAKRFHAREHRWPKDLEEMKTEHNLLSCPYQGGKFFYLQTLETYNVFCQGANHTNASVPADRPAYNSVQGLIER